jgi:hypothetical protein
MSFEKTEMLFTVKLKSSIVEKPWVCESAIHWGAKLSCDVPTNADEGTLCAMNKPNLPSAPASWERQIKITADGSLKFADIYYTTPTGNKFCQS